MQLHKLLNKMSQVTTCRFIYIYTYIQLYLNKRCSSKFVHTCWTSGPNFFLTKVQCGQICTASDQHVQLVNFDFLALALTCICNGLQLRGANHIDEFHKVFRIHLVTVANLENAQPGQFSQYVAYTAHIDAGSTYEGKRGQLLAV